MQAQTLQDVNLHTRQEATIVAEIAAAMWVDASFTFWLGGNDLIRMSMPQPLSGPLLESGNVPSTLIGFCPCPT